MQTTNNKRTKKRNWKKNSTSSQNNLIANNVLSPLEEKKISNLSNQPFCATYSPIAQQYDSANPPNDFSESRIL